MIETLASSNVLLAAFAGYAAAFALYFISFESRQESHAESARGAVFVSMGLHAFFLMATFASKPRFAVTNLPEAIATSALLLLLASRIMERHYHAKFLMLFSLPAALLFCLFSYLLFQRLGTPAGTQIHSGWLWTHTVLILSGLACLVLAASSAVMYLIQSRQIKSRNPGRAFFKLPPLATIDRLHFATLSIGSILFSLGILTGLLWVRDLEAFKQVLRDPSVPMSFLTCALYWAILGFRMSAMRRGQKIAAGTLAMLLVVLATLAGSTLSTGGFHGRL